MRVCFVTKDIGEGGSGRSLRCVLQYLDPDIESVVLARGRQPQDPGWPARSRYRRITSGFIPLCYESGARDPGVLNYMAWLWRVKGLPRFLRTLRELHADVVVLNGFPAVWYAPFIARRLPVVLIARELLDKRKVLSRTALGIVQRWVSSVVCITEHEQAQFSGRNVDTRVIYNSYTGAFPDLEERTENRATGLTVGVFGSIQRDKGQFLVVQAVQRFADELRAARVRFRIYGGDSPITVRRGTREQLLSEVAAHHLEDIVSLPGWTDDVEGAMRGVDVVLRTDLAGCPWGRDIIEAMSNGRPVIAAGSSQIFVRDGVTGYLYAPGDVGAMAAAVLRLADDPAACRRMGAAGRTRAEALFDPATNARALSNVLRAAASGARARRA